MEKNLIEKLPVHIHYSDPDQPYQLKLISNQEIKSLEEEIWRLKKTKNKLKMEKLENLNSQEKNYNLKIASLQKENAEKLAEETEKLNTLKEFQAKKTENLIKDMKSIKDFHRQEITQREERFQRAINNEISRYHTLQEDIEELKLKFNNELSSFRTAHEEKMKSLASIYTEKIEKIQNSYSELLKTMQKDANSFEKHFSQIIFENTKEISKMCEKTEVELKKEKQNTKKFNELMDSQQEIERKLTKEKQKEEGDIKEMEDLHKSLMTEVESLRNKFSKTEEQIKERDDVISRKENTIKELKAFNIHLINFHFVLNQKIATLKEERDPLDRKIREKEICVRDMYNELLEEFSKKNSLKEKSGKLKDKNKAVEELNNSLRSQIFQNKRKMTLFRSELAQMIRTVEKDRLRFALKELYDKQIKRAKTDEVGIEYGAKNADIRETLIEASFQKSQKEILKYHDSVKERLTSIQKQNKQYQKEKTQAIFKKQHENAFLISTCNELRNEKQKLLRIISKLKDEIKELNSLMPAGSDGVKGKMGFSSSMPAFTDINQVNMRMNFEKKPPGGKLQSIVSQLDKNKDRLGQQTLEFKRLEKKVAELIQN